MYMVIYTCLQSVYRCLSIDFDTKTSLINPDDHLGMRILRGHSKRTSFSKREGGFDEIVTNI